MLSYVQNRWDELRRHHGALCVPCKVRYSPALFPFEFTPVSVERDEVQFFRLNKVSPVVDTDAVVSEALRTEDGELVMAHRQCGTGKLAYRGQLNSHQAP